MDLKKQEIEDYYREHLTSDYKPAFYQPRYQRILEFLKDEKKSTKILDIGCGAGDLLLTLKEAGFKNTEGLDYSIQAKNFAEKRGLEVTLCDFEKETPPFKEKFDAVICGDILEHVFEPGFFLGKVKQLLKQNGWLIISVPNAGWYLNGLLLTFFPQLLRLSPAFGVWTHVNQFTVYTLGKLLTRSGFKIERMAGVSFIQTPAEKETLFRKFIKRMGKLPIKFTDLFSNLYPPIFSSHLIILAIKK